MFNRSTKFERRSVKKCKSWSLYFGSYISLISPTASINRFMGFLPCKLESSKLVYSKSYSVFSTISIIIYLTCVFFSLYEINVVSKNLLTVAAKLHVNLILCCGSMIFIINYVKSRPMIRVMNRVSNVSRILPSEIFCEVATRILIKDTLFLMPLVSYIPHIIYFYRNYIFGYISWYTFFGVIVLTSLYTNNVYVLNVCFKYINNSLAKVKEILVNDEPHLLRRVYHMQKNTMLLTKLRTLKQQHLEMSEVVQLLNNTCSMQIEAMFTIMFIDITFNMYHYLVLFNEVGKMRSFSFAPIFAILYIVHIIITVSIVEITRSQMAKIGSSVHRILVHTFDDQVTTELELFSLQVLQKGNAFVMKGLAIDATLLAKMACGITTLLLILIQFLFVQSC
ncbi:uncharacterized protein LOC122574234 isoform X2 [Bombus pyrosoma]|uniref:uncharacterized protein LOC122574234 isoform X2 n=1 Tax=Bombus pyrosoma TaxID=396416 RepID=UPI001CB8B073|nr:uncharacterized protein LOC122574234 isoform X2 [Bombus pyrosoma]